MQESSEQFHVVKCSTPHTGHCVQKQNKRGHDLCKFDFQSHTQFHTGMLVQSVSQQCSWSTLAALVDKGNLLHLLLGYSNFQQPFQHILAAFQKCWDMWSFPTWCTLDHQYQYQLGILCVCVCVCEGLVVNHSQAGSLQAIIDVLVRLLNFLSYVQFSFLSDSTWLLAVLMRFILNHCIR